jgi:cysteine-rich repeat protein
MNMKHVHLRLVTGALAWGLLAAACADLDGPGSAEATSDDSGESSGGESTDVPTTGGQGSCGDGVVDPGEGCDDGAANSARAACTPACEPASCGDGYVLAGVEACDDGNNADGDECTASCGLPSCGDGLVSNGEACDDGDDDNSDACLEGCVLAFCGDGYVREGAEECDDGDADNSDGCLVGCTVAVCGDGYVQDGVEGCDDGNADNSDGCLEGCAVATCGDGYVHVGEEACDDGNAVEGDGCSSDCKSPATCADGLRNGGETDVDCGGPDCGGCGDALACGKGSDCGSTFCDAGACVSPRHCRDIRDLGLAKADGVYPVDPDGSAGESAAVAVFCEMTFDGGGWTAVFNMRQPPLGEAAAAVLLAALSDTGPSAGGPAELEQRGDLQRGAGARAVQRGAVRVGAVDRARPDALPAAPASRATRSSCWCVASSATRSGASTSPRVLSSATSVRPRTSTARSASSSGPTSRSTSPARRRT